MNIPRIYYPLIPENSEKIILDGNSAHHLIAVLRVKMGEAVILWDGNNNQEYHTTIHAIEKKKITLQLQEKKQVSRESPMSIHLLQGISKGDRMDWIVQKAVELGVSRITPIITQHGAVKLDQERMIKKVEHWQHIAISACEQCGRNTLPMIDPVMRFEESVEKADNSGIRWMLHPEENPPCAPLYKGGELVGDLYNGRENANATLLIGPEGGFSNTEVSHAIAKGYKLKTIGPRILRTETAPLVAITLLQQQWGDFT